MKTDSDILIIGGGVVGLTCALACAHMGLRVALVETHAPETSVTNPDGRASAISNAAFRLFENIELDITALKAEPIHNVWITDCATRKPRPCNVSFACSGQTPNPMGHIVKNQVLKATLWAHILQTPNIITHAPAQLSRWQNDSGGLTAHLDKGTCWKTTLLVAADGHNSLVRTQADIPVIARPYRQKILSTTIGHSLPHNGIARQLFFKTGPLALLPLPDNHSHIIWSDAPQTIDAALGLDEVDFLELLGTRIDYYLGDMTPGAPRVSHPTGLKLTMRYSHNRCVLIGDAAHSFHPLAGQGLNMGLRDAAALADSLKTAHQLGMDLSTALEPYTRWRKADNQFMALGTEMLLGIFSLDIPFAWARHFGLRRVRESTFLRQFLVAQASGQPAGTFYDHFEDYPSLMT